MANFHESETRVPSNLASPPTMPRWVKVSMAITLILIVVMIIVHLSSSGSGINTHMSGMQHGVQP